MITLDWVLPIRVVYGAGGIRAGWGSRQRLHRAVFVRPRQKNTNRPLHVVGGTGSTGRQRVAVLGRYCARRLILSAGSGAGMQRVRKCWAKIVSNVELLCGHDKA